MADYRRAFERFAGSLDAVVLDDGCLGPRLDVIPGDGPAPARWHGGFSMGSPRSGWREMLGAYAALLAGLPAAGPPLASWWHGLEPVQREAWQTLLPLLPGFTDGAAGDRGALLERARRWALSRVSRFGAVDDGSVAHE
jgi:hypothetical protein